MAGTLGSLTTSTPISTTTSAKTILQLTASANIAAVVKRLQIAFAGTNPTADKIRVRILRSATGGSATSRTPAKLNASDSETLQATGKENFTAEPTGGTSIFDTYVHPQGSYEVPRAIKVKAGETLGIEVTAVAAVNCIASIDFEE